MKKLLWYGDSPAATTGQGRLHKYLLPFFKDYEITIVGVNHAAVIITPEGRAAYYDKKEYPYNIITPYASQDTYGINIMRNILNGKDKFDLIITSCDSARLEPIIDDIVNHKLKAGGKWILYTPIDFTNIPSIATKIFELPDRTVFLSKYAADLVNKVSNKQYSYIYHPLDIKDYPEITKEQKKNVRSEYFDKWNRHYIIGNFNRNQYRKDLPATLQAFKKLYDKDKSYRLYLHTKLVDNNSDLSQTVLYYDIDPSTIILLSSNNAAAGLPQAQLNMILQSIDLGLSTSLGEGFGYTMVEHMITKKPVVMPNNTSHTEIVADRGYLVKQVRDIVMHGHDSVARSLSDIDDIVTKVELARSNEALREEKVQAAYDFVISELNLKKIKTQWMELIREL